MSLVVIVVQDNSNNGINSFGIKACNTANLHTLLAIEFSHFIQCETGFRKTMDSSEDEGLFITQSSTKGDITAEIEGNVV